METRERAGETLTSKLPIELRRRLPRPISDEDDSKFTLSGSASSQQSESCTLAARCAGKRTTRGIVDGIIRQREREGRSRAVSRRAPHTSSPAAY